MGASQPTNKINGKDICQHMLDEGITVKAENKPPETIDNYLGADYLRGNIHRGKTNHLCERTRNKIQPAKIALEFIVKSGDNEVQTNMAKLALESLAGLVEIIEGAEVDARRNSDII